MDLNDKFDFLMSLMIQQNKLQVKVTEDADGEKSTEVSLNYSGIPSSNSEEDLPEGQKLITDPKEAV